MASEVKTIEVDGETYEYTAEKPWRDADLLEELYWEKEMSQREIGDAIGCATPTVRKWADRLDVGVRTPKIHRPPTFHTDTHGYESWATQIKDKQRRLKVHRLLAVAECGFDNVCGMVVHHKNGIRWDNRPDNIELKTNKKHRDDHISDNKGTDDFPWRDEDILRHLYHTKSMTIRSVADELGCSQSVVQDWMERNGIETRSRGPQANSQIEGQQQTLTEAE